MYVSAVVGAIKPAPPDKKLVIRVIDFLVKKVNTGFKMVKLG